MTLPVKDDALFHPAGSAAVRSVPARHAGGERDWLAVGASRDLGLVMALGLTLATFALWRVAGQLEIALPLGMLMAAVWLAAALSLLADWRRHGRRSSNAAVVAIELPALPRVSGLALAADAHCWRLRLRDGREHMVEVARVYFVRPACVCMQFCAAGDASPASRLRRSRVEFVAHDAMPAAAHRGLRQALLLGAAAGAGGRPA